MPRRHRKRKSSARTPAPVWINLQAALTRIAFAVEVWVSAHVTTYGPNDKPCTRAICDVCGSTLIPEDCIHCPSCGVVFDAAETPPILVSSTRNEAEKVN